MGDLRAAVPGETWNASRHTTRAVHKRNPTRRYSADLPILYATIAGLLTISRFPDHDTYLRQAAGPGCASGTPFCVPTAIQPMPLPILRAISPSRIMAKLSVRARIVAITLIPVAGFLANGVAYMAGERNVDRALDSVQRASALADASREFKSAIGTIQSSARGFAERPRSSHLQMLSDAQAVAAPQFAVIRRLGAGNDKTNLDAVGRTLARLQGNFEELRNEYARLGADASTGIQADLRQAAANVEAVIGLDMTWIEENSAHLLIESLLLMRRFEATYMLQFNIDDREAFRAEFNKFNKLLDGIVGAEILKTQVRDAVKNYSDAFDAWMAWQRDVASRVAGISSDADFLIRSADASVSFANEQRSQASSALALSQARTRAIMIWVGLTAVVLGLAFGLWIGRSITKPLHGLADVMKRLADGDTSARIPATQARDEIGAMARAVIVFRDNMIERERLTSAQAETTRAREQRGETIAVTITRFEMSVDQALAKVREAATKLETASTELSGAADLVSAEARTAEERVGLASGNVTAAAGSVEELAASIAGIAEQATRSTEVATRAVTEAHRTGRTMSELGEAATRIGEVVGLIQAIAGQTNLLALNATIEAARAGAAGRGFAVVASEVKSLASQTSKATEEIASQVGAIQSAVADAAQAIEQVNGIIEEMSAIASTVAVTVEEQNQAVAIIAEGVNRASSEARTGADAMSRVAGASSDARGTAVDVKALADALAEEAESLDGEVRRFLADVQAA
jgi:methyl-accepting chemotaxis protein